MASLFSLYLTLPLFPFSLVFYVNNNIFSSFINNNRIIKNKLIISLFRFFPIKLLPNNSKKFSVPTAIKLQSFHQSRANSSKVSNNLLITFDYNNSLLLLNKFIAIIFKHHQWVDFYIKLSLFYNKLFKEAHFLLTKWTPFYIKLYDIKILLNN